MKHLFCHAKDGDCVWKHCPQEIERHARCPLDTLYFVYHDEDGSMKSDRHHQAWDALRRNVEPPVRSRREKRIAYGLAGFVVLYVLLVVSFCLDGYCK